MSATPLTLDEWAVCEEIAAVARQARLLAEEHAPADDPRRAVLAARRAALVARVERVALSSEAGEQA